jgi:hypothetical protein
MRAASKLLTAVAVASAVAASGCAGSARLPLGAPLAANGATVAGVWAGVVRGTVEDGAAAGDTRIERQEWHLDQKGATISGYYVATLTLTSGDGRPYLCSRQPSFSELVRFDVRGKLRGNSFDLVEVAQRVSSGPCSLGERPLAQYRAQIAGDVITLVTANERQTLHRSTGGAPPSTLLASTGASVAPAASDAVATLAAQLREHLRASSAPRSQNPADVSGVWIWEHRGQASTGDEKQEREEWHVDQEGDRISGYYDRVVREISTDGQAFRCSMNTEFQIATRYRIRGEVVGNQLVIYENAFEVLEPNACDNGQRRLDAYEGLAADDEVRLLWGAGGQVLHRPRPDVPTQRF